MPSTKKCELLYRRYAPGAHGPVRNKYPKGFPELMKTFPALKDRWSSAGGYRELLLLALPLILSTSSWSIQHFVDRMFLTWYSPEAIAASMPAGMLNFATMSIFIGTASYTSIFVAQYFGAGTHGRISASCWQGVYIAFIGAVLHAAFIPFAGPFFSFVGHDPLVMEQEVRYYQILCVGAFPAIASSALAGFFTGLGRTWPVMWVNVIATAMNLLFDYLLIFGKLGLPEMGIRGAAVATVMSGCVNLAAYLLILALPAYRRPYKSLGGWRFERELFSRLLRFGFPNGMQFFIDVAGFTAFVLLVGRLGTRELAASNIAFNINTLAFMPMIGFGIAVSVLVGQYLGAEKPAVAERSVYSGFHLTFIYMAAVAALYVLVPWLFISPFASGTASSEFPAIAGLTVVLLRFVALYSLFDTMNIIFASALKGAGDTRFVMYMLAGVSAMVLVLPTYLAIEVFGMRLYASWIIASAYVIVLGCGFLLRFLGGKWKSMRVIEPVAAVLLPPRPEVPAAEFEP